MSFRDRLKRRLCWLWWSFRKESPSSQIKFPGSGFKPRHLMLVLPPEFHEFDVARRLVEPLIRQLEPMKTTIVVRENFRTWLARDPGIHVLTFDLNKKNWLGLPSNGICEKTRELAADLAIDLTPIFSPYTAALCASSNAPVRITLDGEETHGFYNVQLQSGEPKDLADRYQNLLQYV